MFNFTFSLNSGALVKGVYRPHHSSCLPDAALLWRSCVAWRLHILCKVAHSLELCTGSLQFCVGTRDGLCIWLFPLSRFQIFRKWTDCSDFSPRSSQTGAGGHGAAAVASLATLPSAAPLEGIHRLQHPGWFLPRGFCQSRGGLLVLDTPGEAADGADLGTRPPERVAAGAPLLLHAGVTEHNELLLRGCCPNIITSEQRRNL